MTTPTATENKPPERNILLELSSPYKPTNSTPYQLSSNSTNYRTPTRNTANHSLSGYSRENGTGGGKAVKFTSPSIDAGCHKEVGKQ